MSQNQFWKTIALDQLDKDQWESLCDGCGKCCVRQRREHTDWDESLDQVFKCHFWPPQAQELLLIFFRSVRVTRLLSTKKRSKTPSLNSSGEPYSVATPKVVPHKVKRSNDISEKNLRNKLTYVALLPTERTMEQPGITGQS